VTRLASRPSAEPVRIVSLAEAPGLVAPLADAFALEWPEWAARVPRERIEQCFECGPGQQLPRTFAAVTSSGPVGTVSLRAWFGEEPMAESPWIRGLFVWPGYRGRGIDRLLIGAAEQAARALGFGVAYAATSRIEALALHRGWQVFRRVEHDGEPLAWMRKGL
jgi:GNAT superfamily N-acetyltransferase